MRPRYGKPICVTYKDIDLPLYRVDVEDLYRDMQGFKHVLDPTEYSISHSLFDPNKKVPSIMTDELNGSVLKESVIPGSNINSIKLASGVKKVQKVF